MARSVVYPNYANYLLGGSRSDDVVDVGGISEVVALEGPAPVAPPLSFILSA